MSSPKITSLTARAVLAPFNRPPVSASGAIEKAALVLLDLETNTEITGRAYLFAFTESMLKPTVLCVEALAPLIVGRTLEPQAIEQFVREKFQLIDTHGILGQAISGLDMAAWDAYAQSQELPLAKLLGAAKTSVPAYNSCGLWIQPPETLGDEALMLCEGGFGAMKVRIGRPAFADDLNAVRAVRDLLPNDVHLMSDFNQSLSADEALKRCSALDDEGLYWIEEPIRHDDFVRCAELTAKTTTPIQIGENLRSELEFDQAIRANAANFYMPDVQRIGGVSGWLRAAALAEKHQLKLSSHLFPEISVHLLAASKTNHWLEYVDWANPILEEPLTISEGIASCPDKPGHGMKWDEDAIKRYQG